MSEMSGGVVRLRITSGFVMSRLRKAAPKIERTVGQNAPNL